MSQPLELPSLEWPLKAGPSDQLPSPWSDLKGARVSVTIGNFDGLHLGHSALIRRAAEKGSDAVVLMTFDPHPAQFFAPERSVGRLLDRWLQLRLAGAMGVTHFCVQRFDRSFASLSAQEFHEVVLGQALGASHIVIGHDFRYGHRRTGHAELLRAWGHERGVEIDVLSPVLVDELPVSSSRIRSALAVGDLALARRLLGRGPYFRGEVVRGDGRGRQLGVPTANIAVGAEGALGNGVYAVRVLEWPDASPAPVPIMTSDGQLVQRGVANLGTAPTLRPGPERRLEVHLLETRSPLDLYGRKLLVEFVDWIRPERRFSGLPELVAQIESDRQQASAKLGE